MPIDDPGDRSRGLRTAGDRAIQLVEAKATRFVAGTHWIPGVVVDALGGAREGAPRPDSQIIGRDCRTDVERDGTEASLKLPDPEALPSLVVSERPGEIEQR